MKAGNQKQKGNRTENECAKILNKRFKDKSFRRVPQSGAMFGQSNKIGTENVDEEIKSSLSGDILCPINFKYSIEHKAYQSADFWYFWNESSDLHSWMNQCQNDANFSKKLPMLVVKFNNHKRIVFIHEKLDGYILEHRGWYCYNFEELLRQGDEFFFE